MEPDQFTLSHNLGELSGVVRGLEDYFGVWAIHDLPFRSLVDSTNGLNLHAHVASEAAHDAVRQQMQVDYPVTRDGIAVLRIEGPMMKRASSLSGGTSTIRLRQQLRAARANTEVLGAMLVMDTPGGTVKGNSDLAAEVAWFRAEKPIFAYIEDMTASAGVSVASQATARYANTEKAAYGGMGTYAVLIDRSKQAEQLGVEVLVIRAGDYKGAGTEGTQITEEQRQEFQRVVDSLNDSYIQMIARGLNQREESIRKLADGRIIFAADAVAAGLLNGIQSYEDTYRQLVTAARPRANTTRRPSMSETNTQPQAATLADLKTKFPKSTAEWRESQLERNATIEDAAIAYAEHVQEQAASALAAKDEEIAKAKAEAEKSAKRGPRQHAPSLGLSPIDSHQEEAFETGDPLSDFHSAVAALCGKHPSFEQRQAAIRTVANRQPALYEQYLLATNGGSRRKARLIQEKCEAAQALQSK